MASHLRYLLTRSSGVVQYPWWCRGLASNCSDGSIRQFSNRVDNAPRKPNPKESGGADLRSSSNKLWTIPNILCFSRIAMSPVLSYLILTESYWPAVGILVVAGLSDFADGWIARRFAGQASEIGSFLDPLADKVLVTSLYASLAYTDLIPVTLVELIIARDVILLISGAYIRYIAIPEPKSVKKFFYPYAPGAQLCPTMLSKMNTAVQLVTAGVSLCAPMTQCIPQYAVKSLWYLAGFTTVSSGISYIFAKNTYKLTSNVKKPKSR